MLCKQTDSRRWIWTQQEARRKWLVQGNQNHLCGPLMRSNCCCDSHSTTRQVSCKKGSISSAARTQACGPPLLLLLRYVAGFRGQLQEVEEWGDGVIVLESMWIRCLHENERATFSDYSFAFSWSVWMASKFSGMPSVTLASPSGTPGIFETSRTHRELTHPWHVCSLYKSMNRRVVTIRWL